MVEKIYTSESPLKIDAAKQATQNYEVVGTSTDSKVNSQPVGIEEILEGARNRIRGIEEKYSGELILVIENGLIQEDGSWFDIGAVMIKQRDKEEVGWTEKVLIPQHYVDEVFRIGPQNTTIGKVIAGLNLENAVDHQDPHRFLTENKTNRRKLLKDAISETLERFLAK